MRFFPYGLPNFLKLRICGACLLLSRVRDEKPVFLLSGKISAVLSKFISCKERLGIMQQKRTRDKWHILIGIAVILCGVYFVSAPFLTLIALTVVLGVALFAAGVYEISLYGRFRDYEGTTIMTLVFGVITVVIALFIFSEPTMLASIFPWMIGIGITVLGLSEVVGAPTLRREGVPTWVWTIFAGIVSIVFGLMVCINPLLLSLFIGCFVILRGLTMTINGITGR